MSITIGGRPLSSLPRLIRLNLRYLVGHAAELALDHWYRIDTSTSLHGYESLSTLNTVGDKSEAHPYAPTPFGTIKRVLAHLPRDVSDYSFVDYGSGRGRVILMAARKNFREVIGIEFAESLHRIAEVNIQRLRGERNSRVRSLLCSAEEFEIPDGPCVLYLYNPFEAPVVNHIARKVISSYQENPRHIIVIYYNQTVLNAFELAGSFKHTKTIMEGFLSGLVHPRRYTVRILEARCP